MEPCLEERNRVKTLYVVKKEVFHKRRVKEVKMELMEEAHMVEWREQQEE